MRGKKNSELKLAHFLHTLKVSGHNLSAIFARAKIPRSTGAAWAAGQMPADLNAIKRLSQATGFSTHYILWGTEDELGSSKSAREQILLDELFSGKFEVSINLKKIVERKKSE